MRIIIAGGGTVGFSLAQQLSMEKHEVTVIDPDEAVVERISNALDVICYVGNAASFPVLKSLNIEECDLLIAMAGSDEQNLLICLCAHKLGAKHTVARVRNPEYAEQLYEMKEDLGLSMVVNPEKAAAKEIARILRFPSVSGIELFARGRVELVSFRLPQGNVLHGKRLCDLTSKLGINVLICAVDRDDELIIPSGNFTLSEGDELYVTGTPDEIEKAFRRTGLLQNPVRNVMVTGGGRLSYYLGQELQKQKQSVKIIEIDEEVARDLQAGLPDAVVLCGDASDHELLLDEGLDQMDAYVALTGLDEGNILGALFALQKQVPKVIAKLNQDNLYPLTRDLGIETLISPKAVTANQILRYVRAVAASEASDSILTLHRIVDGRAEVVEFQAESEIAHLTGIPLSQLKLKRNLLLATIVRGTQVIIPGGSDCILTGDHVLIVTAQHRLTNLRDILED